MHYNLHSIRSTGSSSASDSIPRICLHNFSFLFHPFHFLFHPFHFSLMSVSWHSRPETRPTNVFLLTSPNVESCFVSWLYAGTFFSPDQYHTSSVDPGLAQDNRDLHRDFSRIHPTCDCYIHVSEHGSRHRADRWVRCEKHSAFIMH